MPMQEAAAGLATTDSMQLFPRICLPSIQLGRSPQEPSFAKGWRTSLGEVLLLPQRFPFPLPGSLTQPQWKGDQCGCPPAQGHGGHPKQSRCSQTSQGGRRGSEAGGDGAPERAQPTPPAKPS
uniref:Uncharacterized protein n=1 Tax=Accipiter nisus TaxID=211598 RepID=A0A8B9MVP7_9AVES